MAMVEGSAIYRNYETLANKVAAHTRRHNYLTKQLAKLSIVLPPSPLPQATPPQTIDDAEEDLMALKRAAQPDSDVEADGPAKKPRTEIIEDAPLAAEEPHGIFSHQYAGALLTFSLPSLHSFH